MSASLTDRRAVFEQARQARIALARRDAATFCDLTLLDERTAQAIELAPFQESWHQLLDRHRRLVLWSFIESGKSAELTIGRTLFELGRDHSLRCAIISNTQRQASKFLGSIARYIKTSAELREVFPTLLPGDIWRTDAITVQRPTVSKDPSVQAVGVHGNVLGARLDLIVADDLIDYENSRTPEQRDQLVAWFASTVLGRLSEHGRVIVLGTAWHPDDLMHRLSRNPGWSAHRFGVEDDSQPSKPRWPARWSTERIAEKRKELGPLEAARQLDCLARADEDSRFKEEWLRGALARGRDRRLLPYLLTDREGCFVTCGVDLAVSSKRTADRSAISSVLVYPNGDRELLALETGRWDAGEIITRIHQLNERFRPLSIVVESNAAQMYIHQMVRRLSAVPIVAFNTGRGQMSLDWQCAALATEFSNGKWILPSGEDGQNVEPEVHNLVRDLLYYSPKEHTPDAVASLCFARVGAGRGAMRAESAYIDIVSR